MWSGVFICSVNRRSGLKPGSTRESRYKLRPVNPAQTSTTTAALRVYNLTRTAGFQPSTAALATTMQLVSFVVVLVFFHFFGSRYLKGTYLI